jgi:TRAP-type C4-dicarboxylate transport system permease small subunit
MLTQIQSHPFNQHVQFSGAAPLSFSTISALGVGMILCQLAFLVFGILMIVRFVRAHEALARAMRDSANIQRETALAHCQTAFRDSKSFTQNDDM